jgi:ABC-type dipeptide/oligopeptide/nickel transport system ATPase subunit
MNHVMITILSHPSAGSSVRSDSGQAQACQSTRSHLLRSITDWICLSTEQRVLWLHGLAGSGKSTLSTTIATFCRERESLGAFIFFDQYVEERNQPWNVIRTIAYQLALFDTQMGAVISSAIHAMLTIAQSSLRF